MILLSRFITVLLFFRLRVLPWRRRRLPYGGKQRNGEAQPECARDRRGTGSRISRGGVRGRHAVPEKPFGKQKKLFPETDAAGSEHHVEHRRCKPGRLRRVELPRSAAGQRWQSILGGASRPGALRRQREGGRGCQRCPAGLRHQRSAADPGAGPELVLRLSGTGGSIDGRAGAVRDRPGLLLRPGELTIRACRPDPRRGPGHRRFHRCEPSRRGGQQDRDPTGDWSIYRIQVADDGTFSTPRHHNCPCIGDYPHIGADKYGVYLTTNEYSLFGSGFNGAQIYALPKSSCTPAARSTSRRSRTRV